MATYKRIDGDYHIVSVNATDTVYLDTENVEISGNITVTGNAAIGNINVQDLNIEDVVATGNIETGGFFIGDGGFLSNVIANVGGASILVNGLTNVDIPVANGDVTIDINGAANVYQFSATEFSAPTVTAPFVITNQISSGDSSAIIIDDGLIVQGDLEVTGNLAADYLFGNGSQLTGIDATSIVDGTSTMNVVAPSGNIDGAITGNTVFNLSATGLKITGSVEATNGFVGLDATKIQDGTSYVEVLTTNGNIQANVAGTTVALITDQGVEITGNLSVTGNTSAGNITATGNIDANYMNITHDIFANYINATANIAGGNLIVSDTVYGLNLGFTGTANLNTVTATGNVTGGNLTTAGIMSINTNDAATAIENNGSNGVGNIGSATGYFNTIFATATSAQYADIAEKYIADRHYEPGTVMVFGGSAEVTQCDEPNSHRVAGIVSENPAYIMNAGLDKENTVDLALLGRVKCKVRGPVHPGDLLVSDTDGHARVNNEASAGRIVAKSLQFSQSDGIIEVVVGKH